MGQQCPKNCGRGPTRALLQLSNQGTLVAIARPTAHSTTSRWSIIGHAPMICTGTLERERDRDRAFLHLICALRSATPAHSIICSSIVLARVFVAIHTPLVRTHRERASTLRGCNLTSKRTSAPSDVGSWYIEEVDVNAILLDTERFEKIRDIGRDLPIRFHGDCTDRIHAGKSCGFVRSTKDHGCLIDDADS